VIFTDASSIERLLSRLESLVFAEITTILARREDLLSFISTDGELIRRGDPDFGEHIKRWGGIDSLKMGARPRFSYFCGFTGETYFSAKSRSDKKVWILPTVRHKNVLPQVGDIIVGQTEMAEHGMRFVWWDTSCVQDQRFRDILIGKLSYSSLEKYDKKLNRKLFLALMALRFKNLDFFIDMYCRGEEAEPGVSVDLWLSRHISSIDPEFCDSFKESTKLVRVHA